MNVTKSLILILLLVGQLILPPPLSFVWAESQTNDNLSVKDLPYCKREGRKLPPVWVTVTGFDSDTDRSYKKNSNNYVMGRFGSNYGKDGVIKTVPKRSIVRLSESERRRFEAAGDLPPNPGVDHMVQVRVLSTPPLNRELSKAKGHMVSTVARDVYKNPVEVGEEGRIRFGDLERVKSQNDYQFIVKRDTALYKALNNPNNPSAPESEIFALELFKKENLYQVNKCCSTKDEEEENRICRDFPIFKASGVKDKNGKDIFLHGRCELCLLNSLVPMQTDFVKPLQSILSHPDLGLPPELDPDSKKPLQKLMSIGQLNLVDARGMVQIPVKDIPGDRAGQSGPYGSYRYDPRGNLQAGNPDIYLKPEVACGFMQALKKWDQKYCPGSKPHCRVEFGDASHAYNPKFKGHNDHDSGECIDIRPMNKNAKQPQGREFNDSGNNRQDFEKLMRLLKQLGPSYCILGDPVLSTKFGCLGIGGHENHLHICFPRYTKSGKDKSVPNEQLRKACLDDEGVK